MKRIQSYRLLRKMFSLYLNFFKVLKRSIPVTCGMGVVVVMMDSIDSGCMKLQYALQLGLTHKHIRVHTYSHVNSQCLMVI